MKATRFSAVTLFAFSLAMTACGPSSTGSAPPTRGGGSGQGGNAGTGNGNGSQGGSNGQGGAAPGAGNGGAQGGNPGGQSGNGGATPGGQGNADAGGPDVPGGGSVPPGNPVALPLVVTDHFSNRGWFGDASIVPFFKPGLIKEASVTTGPCGQRAPGARGKCLEITYTPPPGYAPPGKGAFLGVYMLTTLRSPQAPAKPGDPNWGSEPGVPVAAGARRVAFRAAALQPGTRVSFRAGSDKDDILLPEHNEVLGTDWQEFSMPFAGNTTGPRIVGGFAYTLKHTGQPLTFYIDDIRWDGEGTTPPTPPMGKKDGVREVVIMNQCKEPVWVAISSQAVVPDGGGFKLDPGGSKTVVMPNGFWSGRFWGRTGCVPNPNGITCETGDCSGLLGCGGIGGKTPATLAEITWSAGEPNPDFYDISLVDGYNLPIAMAPLRGTHGRNPGAPLDCAVPACVSDLNQTCPAELQVTVGGKVVGCKSACERFSTDAFCCRGAHNEPETCPPFDHSKAFKKACPTAYSYAYDDSTSTFTCKGEDYAIWFCP